LAGRRVVITRATDQSGDLAARLRVLGAEPVEVATIAIADPADGGVALRAAVQSAPDWIVVTSANGARRVLAMLDDVDSVRFAVVGPMTASVLERAGVTPALIPPRFGAESRVEAFPSGPGRVVVAQASAARDVVATGLRGKGWEVVVVEAYSTVPVAPEPDRIAAAKAADAILFTSASTVRSFVDAAGVDAVPPVVVCIGPITAEAATASGLRVAAVPHEHTVPAMLVALTNALTEPLTEGSRTSEP
jgi:uroporphyrinogen-III synthase